METEAPLTVESSSPAGSEASLLFSWQDYTVFSASLALPVVIGIFFFIMSFRRSSTEEFLLGERSINFMAVSLSIVASLLNGIFIIGTPAEIHYYGMRICYQITGLSLAVVVVSHVFVKKYHSMLLTSAYQYIEKRFNMLTRLLASAMFCASVTLFLAVVLYVPALAFSQVTNLSLHVTVVITGIICTLYTTIGGIKAVIWTDALQMIILLGGLVTIAIVGASRVGGGAHAWEVAKRTGRANFNNFDPRERTTLWTQFIGGAIVFIGIFVSNQMMVQRYMSVSSAAKAQRSLYGVIPIMIPLFALIGFVSLVLHAYYADCDPLIKGTINKGDKIVPLFLMEILGDYKGLPGLIMSSIFAAALSSVSSVINSLSAVCLEDFIDPAVLHFRGVKLADKTRRWIAVVIVIVFGGSTIGLTFVADAFADKLVQATSVAWGVLGAPLAGIFIMGFLLPFVNSWGAILGMLSGLGMALWVALGMVINNAPAQVLALGTCTGNGTFTPTTPVPKHRLMDWYGISYSWFGFVGTAVCIIVGVTVSLVTGGFNYSYRSSRTSDVIYSVADECCCCCPLSCRKCFRCGVKVEEEEPIKLKAMVSINSDPMFTNTIEKNGITDLNHNGVYSINLSFEEDDKNHQNGVTK